MSEYNFTKFESHYHHHWSREENEWLEQAVRYFVENHVSNRKQFIQFCIREGHIKRGWQTINTKFQVKEKELREALTPTTITKDNLK